MNYGKCAATALLAFCFSPAQASTTYKIHEERFDFTVSVTLLPNALSPTLSDTSGGMFDVIVCSDSANAASATVNSGPSYSVAPHLCQVMSNVKTVQVKAGPLIWKGWVYGRMR